MPTLDLPKHFESNPVISIVNIEDKSKVYVLNWGGPKSCGWFRWTCNDGPRSTLLPNDMCVSTFKHKHWWQCETKVNEEQNVLFKFTCIDDRCKIVKASDWSTNPRAAFSQCFSIVERGKRLPGWVNVCVYIGITYDVFHKALRRVHGELSVGDDLVKSVDSPTAQRYPLRSRVKTEEEISPSSKRQKLDVFERPAVETPSFKAQDPVVEPILVSSEELARNEILEAPTKVPLEESILVVKEPVMTNDSTNLDNVSCCKKGSELSSKDENRLLDIEFDEDDFIFLDEQLPNLDDLIDAFVTDDEFWQKAGTVVASNRPTD